MSQGSMKLPKTYLEEKKIREGEGGEEERPLKSPEAFYIGWILRQVLARWVFVDLVWVRFIWIETHANARVIIS